MDDTFKYEKRYHYPHMKPADVAIWERFIAASPDAYETCQYDVHVGSPPPFDPTVNDATGGDASALYKRKIDVVAHKGGQTDIIELKPSAGTSALGQVRGYVTLYKRDVDSASSPRAVLITDVLGPDMQELARTMGVKLIIV